MATEELDETRSAPLNSAEIFMAFFFVGPLLGVLLLLLLRTLFILFDLGAEVGTLPTLVFLAYFEAGEAVFAYLAGLPTGFLVGLCAFSSFLALGRVSFTVVLAATLAANGLEYLGEWGAWASGAETRWRTAILILFFQLVPASICWWLVRNERLHKGSRAREGDEDYLAQ
jgi:hypothetical protein